MILKDKSVIVSGVGPGMGRKLALLVAKEGAKVTIGARNEKFLAELSAEIKAAGGTVTSHKTDVANVADCQGLVAAAVKAFGTVDGLVNAAYQTGGFAPFESSDLTSWSQAFDVTCMGALRMVQAALPHLKKKGGSVVNIGSQVTRKPMPYQGGYMLGKAGLQAATRQLASELGQYNIRVNSTVIGWMWGAPVEGFMTEDSKRTGVPVKAMVDEVVKNIPLGRMPPDEECARAVVFFLSDYASVVTGASLDVNGGEYLPQ
jgi:NAD(P)-dependent dehydrogenase (short-subunit alcohol dehydrogenase family)